MWSSSFKDRLVVLVLTGQLSSAPLSGGMTYSLAAASRQFTYQIQKSSDHLSRIEAEDREFMNHFVRLPPDERVEIWSHASSVDREIRSTVDWRMQEEMKYALVVGGVDAVPYLSKVLLSGTMDHRLRALKILCDMDRFVPDDEILVEAAKGAIYVKALQRGGRINPFAPVDGHRIGKVGLNAIESVSQQGTNELLQFNARVFTGRLKWELEKLTLEEQIQQWREGVVKTKIVLKESQFPETAATYRTLEIILMERMPESIPPLTKLLEQDKDPYVRQELISLFARADLCSVRLRKLESGRLAIEAIQHALEHGPFRLGIQRAQQEASDDLKLYLGQLLRDEVPLSPGSQWSFYGQALESLFGDKTIQDYSPKWMRSAKPELRGFLSYLTDQDPYFPRWEYTYCAAIPSDEVTYARFRERIKRFHLEWQRFEARDRIGSR